jgi:hypothetical protein
MSPPPPKEHRVHVEPDPDPSHPGEWRVTVDGCLAVRHPDRAEALADGLALTEALREEAPTRLAIDAEPGAAGETAPREPPPRR